MRPSMARLESIKLFLPIGEAKYFSKPDWTLICPDGLVARKGALASEGPALVSN